MVQRTTALSKPVTEELQHFVDWIQFWLRLGFIVDMCMSGRWC